MIEYAIAAMCNWSNPGASPYRGTIDEGVNQFRSIPAAERVVLADMVRHFRYTKRIYIGREHIWTYGPEGAVWLSPHMWMVIGPTLCVDVNRSSWTADHVEEGYVFSYHGYHLAYPDICENPTQVFYGTLPDGMSPDKPATVPEPGTVALMVAGLFGVWRIRRGRT